MPATKTTPRPTQKRRRSDDATAAHVSAPSESDSSSSDASDDESAGDSSDDEETENALFRPVQTRESSSSDDQSSEGEDSDSSDKEASDDSDDSGPTKKQQVAEPSKTVKSDVKPSGKAVSTPTASTSESNELEEEMARKTTATVYVEGIPYKADESDVVSHFATCGSVKEVRMPRYQDSGKPRGYAHIVFDSVSSVAKALKLDGKYLLGRYLTVKVAERPRTLDAAIQAQKTVGKAVKGCKTVFIKHLPYDVEESTVKEALASCGTIVSVRLPLWNHTKKLKGFGYVEFTTEDEAAAAAKRSGMKIGDRMVIISLETAGSAPKASFRLSDGRFWKKGEEAKQSLVTKLTEKSKAPKKGGQQKSTKRQKTA